MVVGWAGSGGGGSGERDLLFILGQAKESRFRGTVFPITPPPSTASNLIAICRRLRIRD